jgi:ABC-2 type transport system permease protein
MFFKIAGFELRYQLRQPIFWIGLILFTLLSFGSVASDNIQIGSTDNVHKNAAYVICQTTLVFAVIYMFVTTAFVANVITRDDETGFGSIIRTTPIRKADYLYGRFAGAFIAAALAFLSVPLGLLLGALAPWVDRETLGPITLAPYVYAYLALGLPILFLTSSLYFALTTVTRSMMWTYVGVIVLLALRTVFSVVLGKPGLEHIAAVWEPFGLGAFGAATHYWTSSERNTLLPTLTGDILYNKLIWLGVALVFLALAYWLFNFQAAELSGRRARKAAKAEESAGGGATLAPAGGLAKPRFDGATTRAQLWARTKLDAGQVFKSPAYFVLLGLAGLLSLFNLWVATDIGAYGGKIYPVTRVMVDALTGVFTFFTMVIAVYYAGELVWRERERRTQEIIDATPVPDWMFIAPKTAAISLVLISTLFIAVAVAIATQAVRGYFDFEIGHYLLRYVLPSAIDMTLLAVLAVFVQALSPNKYAGWAVMVVYLISTLVLSNLGFEHNLYQYGATPAVPLSDMNGMGQYWIGAYWFRLYWSAFAVVLLVLAYGLWRRGTETRFLPRLRRLPHRLNGSAGVILVVALVVFAGSGSWIFYNTNILNPYRTRLGDEKWAADYEKHFLAFQTLPQPKIAKVSLNIQIFPKETRVETSGSYLIQNRTDKPLSAMHVRFTRDLIVDRLAIPGAHLQKEFPGENYRIYAFDTPLQPGETRTMTFATTYEEQGFRNSGNIVDIVGNGTFVNDMGLAPIIGMDQLLLLQDRAKRRKYGLTQELRMPKLGQPGADQLNYIRHDSDWVTADLTVTTDADQIPIAPGYLTSEVVKGGRRTAHFVADSPIMHFFSAQSARYAVQTVNYRGVNISVYYDPAHPWNVPVIQKAMKAGLDYYQANFSPYQFHQVRVLEFPAPQGAFAQSFANTIPWSEGIFFIADNRDPSRIDMVTYVGAHELGHQWWAHQVIGADEQGSTVLSETLAQYSAAMVMKHMYGPDMIGKFLKFELDGYLKGRGGDVLPEQPLEKVEGQAYIHYRKGSLVMYRLQDEIGEDAVNRALRHLLHDYAFKGPPYPTSVALVNDLRQEAPADKQQLITDLFEKITLYDIKAIKAVSAKRPDGRYNLTLTIQAKKLYADGQGRETEAPMNETIDVGAFDLEPGQGAFTSKNVIAFQKTPIHTGTQTVELVVSRLPKFAGVDPYNKLIDRTSEQNVTMVTGG